MIRLKYTCFSLLLPLLCAGVAHAQEAGVGSDVSCNYTIYCLFNDPPSGVYGAVGGNPSTQLRIYLYQRGERGHTSAEYYYSKGCTPGYPEATVLFPEGETLRYSPIGRKGFEGSIGNMDVECDDLGPQVPVHPAH